jgi:hypothetical protein
MAGWFQGKARGLQMKHVGPRRSDLLGSSMQIEHQARLHCQLPPSALIKATLASARRRARSTCARWLVRATL